MAKSAQIRDPIHGFVRLREKELKLVGTRLFQRLRGIRQLAMAHLVYPGALHTRFDHSLGVCHVAGLLAEQLGLQPDEIERVRLAALLHDLGHGPFSHVSEHALERYADKGMLDGAVRKEKIHEFITSYLIRHDPDIAKLLSEQEREETARLLSEGIGRPVVRQIVSGPLDADKQDYLLRDSRFCRVAYGTFDVHQLHRSLVLRGPPDEEELMIDPDGIHAVEQYVLGKYYLMTSVNRHRVRLITDQMILRAIRLGIEEDQNEELARMFQFEDSDDWYVDYTRWDDARFLMVFGDAKSEAAACAAMLRRLLERRLLKLIYHCPIADFVDPTLRERLAKLGDTTYDALRRCLEEAIAEHLTKVLSDAVCAASVIVHAYTIGSVRVSSRNDEGSIMVARHPEPRPFEEESALFKSISEGYTEGYVEVYAPVTWETLTDRKRLRTMLRQPIHDMIEQVIGSALVSEGQTDGSV